MNFLPQASGIRPRVACEITPQGIAAGRAADAVSPLAGVARAELAPGAVIPSLKPGNLPDRLEVIAGLRRVLESLGFKPNARGADITLVIPDAAVRVLLLEFDSLSSKITEALPIIRFRLKKLLPFDPDDAMVTYQVMSSTRQLVRVLVVAIPRDVLSEYETAVREAGYEPGAVLPSTLAAIAALKDESPTLLVNANSLGVTTAIVRAGIVLLHRSVDLAPAAAGTPANIPPAMFEPSTALIETVTIHEPLMVVDPHDTATEWAAQQPLPEHGRNPYAVVTEVQDTFLAPVPLEPFAQHTGNGHMQPVDPLHDEITQAVSVAAAYFEDTLSEPPSRVLSAGPFGAERLGRILAQTGIAEAEGLHVRELVQSEDLLSEAVTASVPRSWLSGITGALRG